MWEGAVHFSCGVPPMHVSHPDPPPCRGEVDADRSRPGGQQEDAESDGPVERLDHLIALLGRDITPDLEVAVVGAEMELVPGGGGGDADGGEARGGE